MGVGHLHLLVDLSQVHMSDVRSGKSLAGAVKAYPAQKS